MTKEELKRVQQILWAVSMDKVKTATSEIDNRLLITLYVKSSCIDDDIYLDAVIETAGLNECITNRYKSIDGDYNVVLLI